MKKLEVLAPVGNWERLNMALHFGADAVYLAGKQFGLRAFAGNFNNKEIKDAVQYVHKNKKKVYVTVNIIAHNKDFVGFPAYIKYLAKIGVDAVICSDIGVIQKVREIAPNLEIHVSTQANVTNKFSAMAFAQMGAKRIVLARELSVDEIKEIRKYLPKSVELECFVHGAMCISYSGRCLLSNYLTGRDSNHGECVQACRWAYSISKENIDGNFELEEDERGTYILNSKDLNLIEHLKDLKNAGVCSFKIEGRMKSAYYVANVVNAYRRAVDMIEQNENVSKELVAELKKSSHRKYTQGFTFGDNQKENLVTSGTQQTYDIVAVVENDTKDNRVLISQKNKFVIGDNLEVLSPSGTFNKIVSVKEIMNEKGEQIEMANIAEQKCYIFTKLDLKKYDILRKKI